jgi:[protein-PII] uridylyltransferase
VRGTTAVLIFARPRRNGFARTTAVLDQLGLNIVDARITPSGDGFSLDLYHVLEEDGAPITDSDRQEEIEHALWRSLRADDSRDSPKVLRHISRQATVFHTPTQINLSADEANSRSVMELTAADRPGLLCDVGKVLMEEHIELQAAKIMTVGERAEDVFYVTDYNNEPLTQASAHRLKERLMSALDALQPA